MENPELEDSLILPDIARAMLDYVSLQPDIDETKVRAASIVAQRIDIQRVIGAENVARCVGEEVEGEDLKLKNLVVPALCYFTHARLLRMFQGTFTDAGYTIDKDSTDRGVTREAANESAAIAETFLSDVVDFLKIEDGPNVDPEVREDKINPRIKVFGGKERRASN
jgi:hypothetical protein